MPEVLGDGEAGSVDPRDAVRQEKGPRPRIIDQSLAQGLRPPPTSVRSVRVHADVPRNEARRPIEESREVGPPEAVRSKEELDRDAVCAGASPTYHRCRPDDLVLLVAYLCIELPRESRGEGEESALAPEGEIHDHRRRGPEGHGPVAFVETEATRGAVPIGEGGFVAMERACRGARSNHPDAPRPANGFDPFLGSDPAGPLQGPPGQVQEVGQGSWPLRRWHPCSSVRLVLHRCFTHEAPARSSSSETPGNRDLRAGTWLALP